jgi:hypothetical protein
MKYVLPILSCLFITIGFSQQSESLIPKEAVTVFSINNVELLDKIGVDELIKYDFMDEIHQELFDGSTDNKSLKDAGINFDQRLNIFYGKNLRYEVSGFTFGIKDKGALFKVFDDFDAINSPYPGAEAYGSFFNNLAIKGNNGLLIRVEPIESYVLEVTDSIWFSRGNLSPYYNAFELDDEISEEELLSQDLAFDAIEKNYNELRDSVEFMIQKAYLSEVLSGLLIKGDNLINTSPAFRELLLHPVAGVFYMDNERNFDRAKNLWYLKTVLPTLYLNIQELYEGNIITGDLLLRDQEIDFNITAKYSEPLGSIYTEMNQIKFDNRICRYIKNDQSAYFAYNINLKKAYEKAYEIVLPMLAKEKNAELSLNVLLLKLANEYINKDALFDTYKGTMFGTFNGIKKVKTRKIEFFYNEQTFEYGERETDAEEDMPIFTLGITTARPDIPELILEHFSQITSKFEKKENYWIYKNAIFETAPLYILNLNGLIICTNDEDLAENHHLGYGTERIDKRQIKALKAGGSLNASIDLKSVASQFPLDFIAPEQQPLMESLKGKSGKLILKSNETSKEQTTMSVVYSFDEKEFAGKHLLDMLNTLYLLTK